jgi:hypothetical protein
MYRAFSDNVVSRNHFALNTARSLAKLLWLRLIPFHTDA